MVKVAVAVLGDRTLVELFRKPSIPQSIARREIAAKDGLQSLGALATVSDRT
jgi:hypothetical protein